ncbi:uncharacterized protein LOC124973014 [Sciurus carolinensis]|uniref:uncharacterized protein LOC124973014 n=1 Tax=Sciurus carolinensis TaxID=30640 RepID=UPI001FB53AC2|nr:uncharacterized protein LOC124973014 [Sciurus carolinensis]
MVCFPSPFYGPGWTSCLLYSFPEVKKWICKMTGLLCSYLAWVFGVSLANSKSWRVWEFNSNKVQFVFIGLWEAYYYQKFNISGTMVDLPVYSTINKSWVISTELQYGQDLILLANFMKTVVLVFSSMAIMLNWIKAPYPDYLKMCYNVSSFYLFLSCGCTAGAVSWNFAKDFYGHTTLDFPTAFPVSKRSLKKKHFSYVFPLGIMTATFSFASACMFLFEMYSLKRNQVKPMSMAKNS